VTCSCPTRRHVEDCPRRGARSGPTQPEDKRTTEQVKLRLPPDIAERLRSLGRAHEGGISGLVAEMVRRRRRGLAESEGGA